MVVSSINFLVFFLVVFAVYYSILNGKRKAQNVWLLLASYFFYGFAEWKMIPLLVIATLIFFGLGIAIGKYSETNKGKASLLTTFGSCIGLGLLLYFKYFNFFIQSFADFFNAVGFNVHIRTFQILLPIGISFFTFKLISYLLEINRGRIQPSQSLVDFAVYIAFFPTLLSGPIDRPYSFLPQLVSGRIFNNELASTGLKRILWGMFMKMCVADRLAIYVNAVFDNAVHHNGASLAFAGLLYPIQMYADFAGYSEMAIGVGALLGLRVTENFNRPFFSVNIAEYWRKWHMSLTSWLTDYVFMPLNVRFRAMAKWGSILAIIITFVLIGLWHGANWTFMLFGLYHGLLYIPLMLSGAFFKKKRAKAQRGGLPSIGNILKMLLTFLLVSVGLILFRSSSISEVTMILHKIGSNWGTVFVDYATLINGCFCMAILFVKDLRDEFFPNASPSLGLVDKLRYELTLSTYILLIIAFGVFDGGQFIYFQF